MYFYEKVHSGRCRDVELSVREGVVQNHGMQLTLSDFCLCGHVAIQSDATAAIGTAHWLGLGKVRHLAVGPHDSVQLGPCR